MLEDHPRRIAAVTKRIAARRLRREPILGDWTAVDVLAHLRACADARGEAIPLILDGRHATLRAIDPRKLIEETDYRALAFATSFRAFARQRARLVKLLRSLPPRAWSRSATFTGFGTPRQRSVLFYARWVARHERAHVRHFERAFGDRARPARNPSARSVVESAVAETERA
ncbi:MAG TPA: DinB family protein [Candidatus Limnocylindria bacterium]